MQEAEISAPCFLYAADCLNPFRFPGKGIGLTGMHTIFGCRISMLGMKYTTAYPCHQHDFIIDNVYTVDFFHWLNSC